MLDEFLGGAGEGRFVLLGKRAGRTEPKRKFVSARRDILITNVEGVTGQSNPASTKSERPPRRAGASERDLGANRGS